VSGPEILESRQLPPAPTGDLEARVRYPLAFDLVDDVGAVSFAVPELYPDIAPGMWCVAVVYRRLDGVWVEADEHDNTTTAHPFRRPATVENSSVSWVDWHSNSLGSCFGIATAATARLTVTTNGVERDLRISPESGAYVAASYGPRTTLAGYAADGTRLGQLELPD
jgi:hypothetical protein